MISKSKNTHYDNIIEHFWLSIRFCGSYQMLLINPNVNIPSFLFCAISCRKSVTCPLCPNLVFSIWMNDLSNGLKHCWLSTCQLLRLCNKTSKNHIRQMLNILIGLNFECFFQSAEIRCAKNSWFPLAILTDCQNRITFYRDTDGQMYVEWN